MVRLCLVPYGMLVHASPNAELRVHFEAGVWKEYADTAKEHPMAQVISAIVQTYKAIGSKTLVMPARSVTDPVPA